MFSYLIRRVLVMIPTLLAMPSVWANSFRNIRDGFVARRQVRAAARQATPASEVAEVDAYGPVVTAFREREKPATPVEQPLRDAAE